MNLSAIVPTIEGREGLLEQTLASLIATVPGCQPIVVRNAGTIGDAWNAGVEQAEGDWLWLGADDVTLLPGWFEEACWWAERATYPCPRIVRPDGSVEACGTLGQGGLIEDEVKGGTLCFSSPFPFLRRSDWPKIGPALPIHYYADDYLAYRAQAVAGLDCRLVRGYSLIHHEGTAGRARLQARAMSDRAAFLQAISEEHRA